jgi:hypothetical protein
MLPRYKKDNAMKLTPMISIPKREPLQSFAEIAAWLGVDTKKFRAWCIAIPDFPKPVQGVKARNGSHTYYRPSEIKAWLKADGVLDKLNQFKSKTL